MSVNELTACIQAILRAQTTLDPFDDLSAHIKAIEIGPSLLPTIRGTLLEADWSRKTAPGQLAVLTALALVAQDIDENEARRITAELTASQSCHPVFLARLRSVHRFSLQNFVHSTAAGIQVLIDKSLRQPGNMATSLENWLAVPPKDDLTGVRRLFVVGKEDLEYWGQYLAIIANITLVWRDTHRLSLLPRLETEYTLYHEIGHHVHRSEDRRDQAGSESRADAYAIARFREAHPLLGWGVLSSVIGVLARGKARIPRARPLPPAS